MWTAIVVCFVCGILLPFLGQVVGTIGVAFASAEHKGLGAFGILGGAGLWITGVLAWVAMLVMLVWKLVVYINAN